MARLDPIPTATLAPLLRGFWTGRDAAWRCILGHPEVLRAGVAAAWRTTRAPIEFGDLHQATLVGLIEAVERHQGLLRPDREDAAPWLYTVVRNMAVSQVRSATRHTRREWREADQAEPGLPEEAVHTEPELAIDLRRAAVDRERFVVRDGARPHHVLAHRLFHAPDAVDLALVTEACAGEGDLGPARSAADTWRLLLAWRAEHGRNPDTTPSRRLLAWILRSTDTTDAPTWRLADPDSAALGLDLLRKWRARAVAGEPR